MKLQYDHAYKFSSIVRILANRYNYICWTTQFYMSLAQPWLINLSMILQYFINCSIPRLHIFKKGKIIM